MLPLLADSRLRLQSLLLLLLLLLLLMLMVLQRRLLDCRRRGTWPSSAAACIWDQAVRHWCRRGREVGGGLLQDLRLGFGAHQ